MREKREPDDDSAPRGRREACLSRRSCPRQNMSGRPRRSGSSSRRVVVAAVSVSPANGGNPDRSSGAARRTPSLLTACGTPDVSGAFVVTMLVCFLVLHARLRMRHASGVPCALGFGGGTLKGNRRPRASKNRGDDARRNHNRSRHHRACPGDPRLNLSRKKRRGWPGQARP